MPNYQYARPYDFVRDFKILRDKVEKLRIGNPNSGLPNVQDHLTGWINVTGPNYGADNTGQSFSDAAFATAFAAATAFCLTVYAPAGIYKTALPLSPPPGVTLLGDFSNKNTTYLDFTGGTVIQPDPSWTSGGNLWNGIISVLGQTAGSYATVAEEQKIIGVMIDCHLMTNLSAAADGIQLYGGTNRTYISEVLIAHAPNHGFNPDTSAGAYRLEHVNVRYAGNVTGTGIGFIENLNSDCSFRDCLAENCADDGFNVTNMSNGIMYACRSEHNGGNGYSYICTNSSTGSGTPIFFGCTSDRNENDGMNITTTNGSGVPVQLVGCRFRRDGRNGGTGGGGFSGINVNNYPGIVIIDGTVVFPGVSDTGTETNSPANGLTISNCNGAVIQISASSIQGATISFNNDGSATIQADSSTTWWIGTTSTPLQVSTPYFTPYPGTSGLMSMVSAHGLTQQVSGSKKNITNGTSPVTTATLTSIGFISVPANEIEANAVFAVTAGGTFTTGATAPGSATLGIYWGGVGGTAIATLAVPILNANLSTAGWYLEAEITWLSTTETFVRLTVGWHTGSGVSNSVVWFFTKDTTGLITTSQQNLSLGFQWTAGTAGWSGSLTTTACRIARIA